MKEKLLSEKGIKLRKKRSIEPESVLMAGLEKVNLEFGLISIITLENGLRLNVWALLFFIILT